MGQGRGDKKGLTYQKLTSGRAEGRKSAGTEATGGGKPALDPRRPMALLLLTGGWFCCSCPVALEGAAAPVWWRLTALLLLSATDGAAAPGWMVPCGEEGQGWS